MFLTNEEVITDDHYLIAKKNGISHKNVYQRYWDYGWDIERAITEAPRPKRNDGWLEWKETAQTNGISNPLYLKRVEKGMTHEQAATTPKRKTWKCKPGPKGSGKYK